AGNQSGAGPVNGGEGAALGKFAAGVACLATWSAGRNWTRQRAHWIDRKASSSMGRSIRRPQPGQETVAVRTGGHLALRRTGNHLALSSRDGFPRCPGNGVGNVRDGLAPWAGEANQGAPWRLTKKTERRTRGRSRG